MLLLCFPTANLGEPARVDQGEFKDSDFDDERQPEIAIWSCDHCCSRNVFQLSVFFAVVWTQNERARCDRIPQSCRQKFDRACRSSRC